MRLNTARWTRHSTLRKTFDVVSFKALPDEDGKTGRFEAHVAMFGNVDLMGDRIVKGAFAKNLADLRAAGDPIPVIWSHNWGDPFAHIGWADPAETEETEKGLRIIGYTDDKPYAKQVYDLMAERRVKEFSFAYDVVKEKTGRDGANELLELEIIEVGPTLKGANPETELLGVKSALERAAGASGASDAVKAAAAALLGAAEKLAEALDDKPAEPATPAEPEPPVVEPPADESADDEPTGDEPAGDEPPADEKSTDDEWALKMKQRLAELEL